MGNQGTSFHEISSNLPSGMSETHKLTLIRDLRSEEEAESRHALKPLLRSLENVVNGNHRNLTHGHPDLGGKYIWEHAASFVETKSEDILSKMTERFENVLNGFMLDYTWRYVAMLK